MTINLNLCNKICHSCVKNYSKKHQLKKGGQFKVLCSGIPDEYVPESIISSLGVDAKMATAIYDPVIWAAEVLDWYCLDPEGEIWKHKTENGTIGELPPYNEQRAKAGKSVFHRPYQAETLRCTSRRKVLRWGRQCIEENEYVYTVDGPIKASEVQEGTVLPGGIATGVHQFEDDILRVHFMNGCSLSVNPEHPFYVIDKGWVHAKDLTHDDWVEFADASQQGADVDLDFAKLMGYMLSDGTWGVCQTPKFTNNNRAFIEDVRQLTKKCFGLSCNLRKKDKNLEAGFDLFLTDRDQSTGNPVQTTLKDLGVFGKQTFGAVTTWSTNALKAFVAGYFQGDGYIWSQKRPTRNGYRSEIGLSIGNCERKAVEMQFILWRLGIYSVVKKEWMTKSTDYFYRVLVSRHDEKEKLLAILDKSKYPDKFQLLQDRMGRYRESPGIRRMSDGYRVRVQNMEYRGKGTVVGWETVGNNEIMSYCGMRTHNSGKSEALSVACLHNLFTRENFRIVLITPFQTQVDLIFKRIEELLLSKPALANSIRRSVKAPNYNLELYNGSMITGFTAGTRSGQNAGAARGQHAQMLIFDESDYLGSGDIDAALAIVTNFPDATVWMASTPTGRRERFFETCQSPIFREFHYSSFVNPNWTKETDDLYRSQLTQDGYKHEILAEFGEQEEGVYQNKYIEAAQASYSYGSLKPNTEWWYTMGVDWNKHKIGTNIAVVAFSPKEGKFRVVDKAVITIAEQTQLTACQKIAELNRLWNPFSIYVDTGYGSTQIEYLHDFGARMLAQHGANHPDARLREIVKGYEFGGAIQVKDLFTGQPVNKPAKPFLVENSVRRFEQMNIEYPKEDESYTKQLQGYIVDRISVAGAPTYKAQNEIVGDHFLDAVNLALVAFTLEKTKLGKHTYSAEVGFGGRFGEAHDGGPRQSTSDTMERMASEHKPKAGRTGSLGGRQMSLFGPSGGELPAANTSVESGAKLWSWFGFGHDAPRPEPPSIAEKWRQAQRGTTRRQRPTRTKF